VVVYKVKNFFEDRKYNFSSKLAEILKSDNVNCGKDETIAIHSPVEDNLAIDGKLKTRINLLSANSPNRWYAF
jgi:hypothetical protein